MTNQEMKVSVETELDRIAGSPGDVSKKACKLYASRLCSLMDFNEDLHTEAMELLRDIEPGSSIHAFGRAYEVVYGLVESKNEEKGMIPDFDDPEDS